jgi:hypothetical protein
MAREKPIEIGEKKERRKSIRDPKTGKFLPGNPSGGRPKGSISIVTLIKQLLAEVPKGEKRNNAMILAANIVRDALRGRDGKDKLVIQYIDGMPLQKLQHGMDEDNPIKVVMVPAKSLKDV